MNITAYLNRLEDYTPTGYTFWTGLHREAYNMEKTIQDTMLVVYPNPYPSDWRTHCSDTITQEIWFGMMVNLKREATEYSHAPYSGISVVQTIHDLADDFIASLNTDPYIAVNSVEPYTFHDSPDGKGVNRQVWLQVTLNLRIWRYELFTVVHSGDTVEHSSDTVVYTGY